MSVGSVSLTIRHCRRPVFGQKMQDVSIL